MSTFGSNPCNSQFGILPILIQVSVKTCLEARTEFGRRRSSQWPTITSALKSRFRVQVFRKQPPPFSLGSIGDFATNQLHVLRCRLILWKHFLYLVFCDILFTIKSSEIESCHFRPYVIDFGPKNITTVLIDFLAIEILL